MRRSMANIEEKISFHTVTVKMGTGSRGDRECDIQFSNMQLIGSGAFGTVYKAVLNDSNELIAIKKLNVDCRFKNRELSIMLEIDHPNVTRLLYYYYSHQGKNMLNLIMEFLPKDLSVINRNFAHTDHKMSLSVIKLYSFQILRGIGFLHLNNIIHRDINPKNVLVDEVRGILKICDFGSAKKFIKNESNISYVCSRYYRAPELLFGSTSYDTSIDTWSCGTVISELLNKTPIFQAESAIDVLVLQIRAFGTPTKDELSNWNYQYVHIPLETVQGTGVQNLIKRKLCLGTIQLLDELMKINPKQRINPYHALSLPFFNNLRDYDFMAANFPPIPSLFNWLEKEFIANGEIIKTIFPSSYFVN